MPRSYGRSAGWRATTDTALGVYGFLVMAAFWWGMPDAATLLRWLLIGLAPAFVLWMPPSRWTVPHLVGLAALGWCALTLAWSENFYDGVGLLMRLCLLGAVFGLGSRTQNPRSLFIGCALGLWVSSLFVITEHFGVRLIEPFVMQYAGLFINPNLLAETSVLVLIGVIVYRAWWAVPGLLPSLIEPGSRGAVIALAAVASVPLWKRWPWTTAGFVLIGAAALFIWSFDGGKAISTFQRIGLLLDNLHCLTWLGSGLGSYDTIFPFHATHIDVLRARAEHAHSDYLELLIELGPGALLFFALAACCLWKAQSPVRFVLAAFLVEASVGFPSYMPASAFIAAFAMGHLCRDWPAVLAGLHRWRNLHGARLSSA